MTNIGHFKLLQRRFLRLKNEIFIPHARFVIKPGSTAPPNIRGNLKHMNLRQPEGHIWTVCVAVLHVPQVTTRLSLDGNQAQVPRSKLQ